MFLEKFIGKLIAVKLRPEALQDKTMDMFYETSRNNGYIMNKLIGVDEIGLWLEGWLDDVTMYMDDDGNEITPTKEDITATVMIPFVYVEGIFIIKNPNVKPNGIGFKPINND